MNIIIENISLPNKPLSNIELLEASKRLNIKNFKGVFLRDTLPKNTVKLECGILNLDSSFGNGTHWVAWYKKNKEKYYFDSYGIQPPTELVNYLKSPILYTTEKIQQGNQVFCGHLCLYVLFHLSNGRKMQDIINELH